MSQSKRKVDAKTRKANGLEQGDAGKVVPAAVGEESKTEAHDESPAAGLAMLTRPKVKRKIHDVDLSSSITDSEPGAPGMLTT